jgi:L-ribulose-5-phosphate 3-epimerase
VRAIQDVGLDNQGVNFDLANLILYGKEIPSTPLNSAARMSRESTRRMGCGRRTRGNLARRSPSARAKWIFREIIERLRQLNYRGAVTIEREISGPQQVADVRGAKTTYLENLIG